MAINIPTKVPKINFLIKFLGEYLRDCLSDDDLSMLNTNVRLLGGGVFQDI